MRHYEIVILFHPEQNEQIKPMVERYTKIITDKGGKIHRMEDWGRRTLAYPIRKLAKAYYMCINVETSLEIITELNDAFKLNDAILRHLVIKMKQAVREPSLLMKEIQRDEARKVAAPVEQAE